MAEKEEGLTQTEVTAKPSEAAKKKVKGKKKGKGKLLIFVLLAVLLLGGGGFGALAYLGKIPGISLGKPLAKGKSPAKKGETEKESKPTAQKPTAAKAPSAKPAAKPDPEPLQIDPPKSLPDLDKGAKTVARIWERIDPEKVVEMASNYKDPQLARILNKMDMKKSAAILGIMDAKRAALLSQEMEKLASLPPPDPGV